MDGGSRVRKLPPADRGFERTLQLEPPHYPLTDLVVRAMRLPKPLPVTEMEQLFEGDKAAITRE